MIADLICNKQDEWFTPKYAVLPLIKYLKAGSTIWCPFDTEQSEFVKVLSSNGFNILYTHLSENKDFFTYPVPSCDYIISNPPYSKKEQVDDNYELEKWYDLIYKETGNIRVNCKDNEFMGECRRIEDYADQLELEIKRLKFKESKLREWIEKEIAIYSKKNILIPNDYLSEQKLIILKEVLERVGEQK